MAIRCPEWVTTQGESWTEQFFKITQENYDSYVSTLATTGNTYDIELEVKVLDENPNKKVTVNNPTQIGENVFVTYYTSQIVQQLDKEGCLLLKEGDQVHVSIANTNVTLAQQLSLSKGSGIATIIAETTQSCLINGV